MSTTLPLPPPRSLPSIPAPSISGRQPASACARAPRGRTLRSVVGAVGALSAKSARAARRRRAGRRRCGCACCSAAPSVRHARTDSCAIDRGSRASAAPKLAAARPSPCSTCSGCSDASSSSEMAGKSTASARAGSAARIVALRCSRPAAAQCTRSLAMFNVGTSDGARSRSAQPHRRGSCAGGAHGMLRTRSASMLSARDKGSQSGRPSTARVPTPPRSASASRSKRSARPSGSPTPGLGGASWRTPPRVERSAPSASASSTSTATSTRQSCEPCRSACAGTRRRAIGASGASASATSSVSGAKEMPTADVTRVSTPTRICSAHSPPTSSCSRRARAERQAEHGLTRAVAW